MNIVCDQTVRQVKRLSDEGWSLRRIAGFLGISKDTANRILSGKPMRTPRALPLTYEPSGLCECGCGGLTTRTLHDDKSRGLKAGQFSRFIHGHYQRWLAQHHPGWGCQYQRLQLREDRRGKLVEAVLECGGKLSLEEIRRDVAPEFRLEGASRLINSARQWWTIDIPRIAVRRQRKPVEPYERRDIPYERETEIDLLVNRRYVTALDGTLSASGMSCYEFLRSTAMSPLELLMLKEDMESEEEQDRQQRIAHWQMWEEARKPLQQNIGEMFAQRP